MSANIPAVYHDGVFHPLQPVDWPDGTCAEVIPLPHGAPSTAEPPVPAAPQPKDQWERELLDFAKKCGVSLPNSALTSESLYD